MRVLQLVHQYPPEHMGGTELYTLWLARALRRRGHQVTVFYRRSAEGVGQEHWVDEGVDVWAVWDGTLSPTRRFAAALRNPALLSAFDSALAQVNPDVVHIQHLMGLPAALVDSVRRQGLPFIISLHDFWWECANANLLTNYSQEVCDGPNVYANCARCALARAGIPRLWPAVPVLAVPLAWRHYVLRRILQAASQLVAPTRFVRDWYVSQGVPADNLVVIAPGLEHAALEPQSERRGDGAVRLAYIGGLARQKGVHVLLEALSRTRGDYSLWIVGDESTDPAYAAQLRSQATQTVRFLGKLTQQGVRETLAQIDVVAVPSLCRETYSYIVSEAFAAGVPVVASCIGALAERVRDGIDGLLIPPGDAGAWEAALQRVMDEPTLLGRLRANIPPQITLDEHVEQIEALYTELADYS
jgi:glycosyltransferase involved in cell wall biosynthesis